MRVLRSLLHWAERRVSSLSFMPRWIFSSRIRAAEVSVEGRGRELDDVAGWFGEVAVESQGRISRQTHIYRQTATSRHLFIDEQQTG